MPVFAMNAYAARRVCNTVRLTAAVFAAGVAAPAVAQSPAATCALAYHTALADLNKSAGESIAGAVGALRAADPLLPGRWIYSQALLGKPVRQVFRPKFQRVCLEPIVVAGRNRCRRYGELVATEPPSLPAELEISPAPTAPELRVLKAVADLVEGQGAIPDVGNNGRHRWLAQRATADLKSYISQPPHPAICSGAREVADFYSAALVPLQKRVTSVGDLVTTARALAVERIAGLAPASGNAAPASGPDASSPAKPLVALVADAVQPLLGASDLAAVRAETSTLAALQRAKPALVAAQAEAQASGDPARLALVLATGRAVRMLEAAAYAEIYAARYARFSAAVMSTPQQIIDIHKRICTCGP